MSLPPTQFHGIPADELHAACLSLGLTMKAKASLVMAMAKEQEQQAKEAAAQQQSAEESPASTIDEVPPPPPPPPAPAAADDNFFVTMHPAITLRPITSCPAKQFEDLQNKQPLWNILIDMLARHPTFLSEVLEDTAASDADFTGRMLAMYKQIYLGEGSAITTPISYQPNMLGIFRNDYMEETHAHHASQLGSYEQSSNWKQVEINTISVSFAGLAPKVGKFHQLVGHTAKNEVDRKHPTALAPEERIHIGESDKVVPGALATAARQYLGWREANLNTSSINTTASPADEIGATAAASAPNSPYVPVVCFVIQENERNTTDQYMLSFEVEMTHNVRCIRRTLRELNESMTLVELPPKKEDGNPRAPPIAVVDGTYEVTVFYFRSCYTPTDFPAEAQWKARTDIEVSAAIKCPSLPYYLCTFKKVQQIITGSRMRADGTALPPPPTSSSANTPATGRSPTSQGCPQFGANSTAATDIDHIQKLMESVVATTSKAKAVECPPTGRRRGAEEKPFGVSAAPFYTAPNPDYADYDAYSSSKGSKVGPNPSDAYALSYFNGANKDTTIPSVWYTNWIRCNFVPIHSLNPKENSSAEDVIADAIANPRNYVLKPQLEGGGNLYSGDEMVTLLRITKPEGDEAYMSEPQKEFLKTYWRVRNEYILMRRINVKKHSCDEVMGTGRGWGGGNSVAESVESTAASPAPTGAGNASTNSDALADDASPLFRMGQIISKTQIRNACVGINHQPNDDLCSELGIYGVILSEGAAPTGETPKKQPAGTDATNFSTIVAPTEVKILLNDSAGYVIRSKLASVDDGGVMAGAAFLDSIALRNVGAGGSVAV